MKDFALKSGMELLLARCAGGNQCSSATFGLDCAELTEQIFAHCHAEIVKILLVSKASGHATAFDARGHHVKSCGAEQCLGRSGGANCLLLTMAVVGEPRFQRVTRRGEDIRKILPPLVENLPEIFDWLAAAIP